MKINYLDVVEFIRKDIIETAKKLDCDVEIVLDDYIDGLIEDINIREVK